MKQIKAEIIKWHGDPQLWSVHASVRRGWLETTNYKTRSGAKRAFTAMCARLGIDKDRYYFAERSK